MKDDIKAAQTLWRRKHTDVHVKIRLLTLPYCDLFPCCPYALFDQNTEPAKDHKQDKKAQGQTCFISMGNPVTSRGDRKGKKQHSCCNEPSTKRPNVDAAGLYFQRQVQSPHSRQSICHVEQCSIPHHSEQLIDNH